MVVSKAKEEFDKSKRVNVLCRFTKEKQENETANRVPCATLYDCSFEKKNMRCRLTLPCDLLLDADNGSTRSVRKDSLFRGRAWDDIV